MHRSWLEVSLGRIAGNFRAVRAVVGQDVTVMPVVKADAYRHGAVAVARSLERAGARWLARCVMLTFSFFMLPGQVAC